MSMYKPSGLHQTLKSLVSFSLNGILKHNLLSDVTINSF